MGSKSGKMTDEGDKYHSLRLNQLTKLCFGYLAQFQRKYRGDNGMKWPMDMLKTPIVYLIIAYFPRRYEIYGIGFNNFGELGLGHCAPVPRFERLIEWERLLDHSTHIYRGYGRFLLKTIYGEIYTSGNNYRGDAGVNEIDSRNIDTFQPIQINHNNSHHLICKIVGDGAISNHTILVSNDPHNQIYGFGSNRRGQFGNYYHDSYRESNWTPTHIFANDPNVFHSETIVKIQCGEYHTLFLTKQGNVYAAGDNLYGQCGVSMNYQQLQMQQLQQHPKSKRHKKKYLPITRILDLYYIIDISCGSYHNLCINHKYELFVFGDNPNGQLAIPLYDEMNDPNNRIAEGGAFNQNIVFRPIQCPYFKANKIEIKYIETGNIFSCVLDVNGYCFLFGANTHGQIGTGLATCVSKPHCINRLPALYPIVIEQISAGYQHTVILSQYNDVYAFGDNEYNQCSSICTKKKMAEPWLLTREEIGIEANQRIERILAGSDTTLVIIKM